MEETGSRKNVFILVAAGIALIILAGLLYFGFRGRPGVGGPTSEPSPTSKPLGREEKKAIEEFFSATAPSSPTTTTSTTPSSPTTKKQREVEKRFNAISPPQQLSDEEKAKIEKAFGAP